MGHVSAKRSKSKALSILLAMELGLACVVLYKVEGRHEKVAQTVKKVERSGPGVIGGNRQ
jgi:hypothetical protein